MSASITSTAMSTHNPGLPDPALIAQWANALFAALPGRPTVPGSAADAQAAPPSSALATTPSLAPQGEFESLPVAPYASPTSGFTPPSEVELRAAPAALASVGGTAAPATSANPPDGSLPYFLDPAQPGLPGTAVGTGPTAASRLEAGAMPTAPSPPAAFAQPAEPSPVALAGAAALPYGFRPELVATPAAEPTPPGGGTAPPAGVPVEAADLPSSPFVEPTASAPSGSAPAAPGAAPFYFLAPHAIVPFNAGPDFSLDLAGFPAGLEGLDLGLDDRAAAPQAPNGQADRRAFPETPLGGRA